MNRHIDWLSPRERTVLVHMMNGLSAEQIAAAEFISVTTVRTYIRNILMKLRCKSQLAAVAVAYQTVWPERQQTLDQLMEAAS